MKRLLLPLLAALALPTTVNAGVDPEVHNLCKDVADYMGCVKSNRKENFLKKILTLNNPEKRLNRKNAEKCLIGLYPCRKVNQDYLSSKLKEKVNDQLTLEKQRKNEKLARDRRNRERLRRLNKPKFTHKGVTYTASKSCPSWKNFYWSVEKGFLKKDKVIEVGCLWDYEVQSHNNYRVNTFWMLRSQRMKRYGY